MIVDPLILVIALICGLALKRMNQPPLLGYLLAGFILNLLGFAEGELIASLADAGVTLLLFSIGLKLHVRDLMLPQVWAVTMVHMLILVPIMALLLYAGLLWIDGLPEIDNKALWAIAFGLSFSSTVFAVKIFEEKGESAALFAVIAIGILIIQDLIAVSFLTLSSGKAPNVMAFLLFLAIPLRPLLVRILKYCGHGELLSLAGFALAFGAAGLFSWLDMKADLGALLAGILLSSTPQSREIAKTLLGFKDLFLVGFFLSIGLSGLPSQEMLLLAILLTAFVWIKPALYFLLFVFTRLRSRTAFLSALALFNYSEFGLIVVALLVADGWLSQEWLVMMAVALSLSYLIASPFNHHAHSIYGRYASFLRRFQRKKRLVTERPADIDDASVMVLGMGRVGSGVYEYLKPRFEGKLIGVEESASKTDFLCQSGFNVIRADGNDGDFWRHLSLEKVDLIMVSLTNHAENKAVLELIRATKYQGKIAVVARFPDELEELRSMGCIAFNLYAEAGHGFAEHVLSQLPLASSEIDIISHPSPH